MSRFGSDPRGFFDSVYRDVPPWDVGGAQPDMASLLDEIPPEGPALDLGCGSGDLALHLARRGIEVLGIDFVEAAIRDAERKAAAEPEEVARRLEFRVAEGLRPQALGRTFRTVLDSGFLHLFDPVAGDRLVEEVAAVLEPRGRLYLHEFATEFPIPNTPRRVTAEELRGRFTAERGWRLRVIRPAEFRSRIAPVPAVLACAERIGS